MSLRFWIRIVGFCAAAIFVAALFLAWRAERRDRALLALDLAKSEQALADANARQMERDQQLAKLLAGFEERKRTVVTPAQIIQQLPRELPLPVALSLAAPVARANSGDASSAPKAESVIASEPSQVVLPAADLKPLYDFAVDCHACQARLAAAAADLADERTKSGALGRERDSALRAARGGSVLRRVARAAKWFVVGATAGAVAARLAR